MPKRGGGQVVLMGSTPNRRIASAPNYYGRTGLSNETSPTSRARRERGISEVTNRKYSRPWCRLVNGAHRRSATQRHRCMALEIQWLHVVAHRRLDVGSVEHRANCFLEGTQVFLAEPALAQRPPLFLQEAGPNARALRGRDRH